MPVSKGKTASRRISQSSKKNAPQGVFLLLYSTFDKKSIVR